ADAGQPSSLGAPATSSASNLVIDGGILRSAMKTTMSTDRLFSVGPNSATLSGSGNPAANASYFGALRFTNAGTLIMSGTPNNRTLTLDAGGTALVGTTERAMNPAENLLAASIPDSGGGNTTSVT